MGERGRVRKRLRGRERGERESLRHIYSGSLNGALPLVNFSTYKKRIDEYLSLPTLLVSALGFWSRGNVVGSPL